MQKKNKIVISICLVFIVVLFYWYFFVDTNHLPSGELIASYPSPDGTAIVNVYNCEGNATSSDSLRAEVVIGDKIRNIYWQYDESLHSVEWISEDIVNINGIQLNVFSDVYDWRR